MDNKERLKHLVNEGTIVLEELKSLSSELQHPRAYEAYSNLLKTITGLIIEIEKLEREDSVHSDQNDRSNLRTVDLQKVINS